MILLEGSGLDQFRLLDESTAPSECMRALEQHSNDKGTMRHVQDPLSSPMLSNGYSSFPCTCKCDLLSSRPMAESF